MPIQLSDSFDYRKLLRFTLPSIAMMVFTSVYGVVDGLFVSNYVGKTAFAAVNLIMPFPMLMSALGFMIGTGGSALVSMTMGQGDMPRAKSLFSMLVYITAALGAALAAVGIAVLPDVARLMGADETMLPYCISYGRIVLLSLPFFMLTNVFQSFLVTAEKPQLGLAVTVGAGVTNMLLDWLLVGVCAGGVEGAAWATFASQTVGGALPLIYFALPNRSTLRLGKCRMDLRALGKTCLNGSSELMSNVSMSLVGILYNWQLMRLAGEDGVAAYGVIMYVNFIFIAIYLGYSIGVAPVIGFHYGAGHHDELKSLLRKSLTINAVMAVVLTALSEVLARPLSAIFVSYDAALLTLTTHAFRVYAISFAMCGFNIFGSAFFTALGNGVVSAAISFLRTLLFQLVTVILLPMVMGVDGVWVAIIVAESLAMVVTFWFLHRHREHYHYA